MKFIIEEQSDGTFRFGSLILTAKKTFCNIDFYWVADEEDWMSEPELLAVATAREEIERHGGGED